MHSPCGTSHFTRAAARTLCGPVERRAKKVHGEYESKARTTDVNFNGCPRNGPPGPVLRKLQEYGRVCPLVIGPFGEINEDFDQLIVDLANFGAEGALGVKWVLARSRRHGRVTWRVFDAQWGYARRAKTRNSRSARLGWSLVA